MLGEKALDHYSILQVVEACKMEPILMSICRRKMLDYYEQELSEPIMHHLLHLRMYWNTVRCGYEEVVMEGSPGFEVSSCLRSSSNGSSCAIARDQSKASLSLPGSRFSSNFQRKIRIISALQRSKFSPGDVAISCS